MILTELTLTNVGLYGGKQTIHLRPKHEQDHYKPIVLIGGKNGAGKTTILDALKLCLYGREALGSKVEKAEYEKYLIQQIHRQLNGNSQAKQARITLEFEHAHAGIIDIYNVERNWGLTPSGVLENFILQKNGEYLSEVQEDIRQQFIKDLLPPGVAQLFFFDGEKIQELAEDDTGNAALAEAVKATFGLNIVNSIKTDVLAYRKKEELRLAKQELQHKISSLEHEHERIQTKLQIIQTNVEDAQIECELLNKQFSKTQENLDREGWLFAQQRDELTKVISTLEANIEHLQKQIRNVEGFEPFVVVPELCIELRDQLLQEEQYTKWEISRDLISEHNTSVYEKLTSETFWQDIPGLPPNLTEILKPRLQEELGITNEIPKEFRDFQVMHDLSEKDRWQLLQYIEEIINVVPDGMYGYFVEFEYLSKQLEDAKAQSNLVPSEELLQPLVEQRDRLIGQLEVKKQIKEGYIKEREQQRRERDICIIQIERVREDIRKDTGFEERLDLAGKVENVITRFYDQMLQDRVSELEEKLVYYFKRLSRKRNMIWKAAIDHKTFSVTLFTKDGQSVSKSSLSAGEKQIYAIALLWALRDISGRPLPVIVDTPLGRLDSDHRRHIVENYFPFASHQVILLSTDTEIDDVYYTKLEPSISHCYRLDYDQQLMCTTVKEGYFEDDDKYIEESKKPIRSLPVLN